MRYFYTLRYLIVFLSLLCTACGTALPSVKPYKLDVQQGNVVTSKMLLQLRPGMTKSQVRFIMGTPLIQDSFHGNRWDYVYQMREAGKVTEQRRVILDFEKDLLKTVRGDVIPTGSAAAEPESKANTGTRVVEPYKKPQEKGLMDKLKFWQKDDAAPANAPADKGVENKEPVEDVKRESAVKGAEGVEEAKPAPAADSDAQPSMLSIPLDVPADSPAATLGGTGSNALAAPVEAAQEANPVNNAPAVESKVDGVAAVKEPVAAEPVKEPVTEAPVPNVTQDVVKDSASTLVEPSATESTVTNQPINAAPYEPQSGMVFDRRLRSLPEEVEPDAVVEIPSTRVGNKTTPTPKDLPPETEPSFFDRMLEKIGF